MNISDIVKSDLCTGCGVCTSESTGRLEMQWDENGFLLPVLKSGKWSDTYNAVKVCPFNPDPQLEVSDEDKLGSQFLAEAQKFDEKLGRYENTYIGYSVDYRPYSSSGGIATYVFSDLLKRKIVDHLFIVREFDGSYEYGLYSGEYDIKQTSKTRYIPVTLEHCFTVIDNLEGTVAISGVACFLKAIRLKQFYHPHYKHKIPFLVGIICGGWKSRFFSDFLAQGAGVSGKYHSQEYRIKDPNSLSSDYSFGAFDRDENFKTMKMSKVGDMWGTGLFKSNACDFCSDVTTELADISLGDAWLPEYRSDGMGNSIVITRSRLAESIIQQGILNQALVIDSVTEDAIIRSQKPSFLHRQDAINFRIRIRKLKRMMVPRIRDRVLTKISLPYLTVQILRMRVRKNSIKHWRRYPFFGKFKEKMSIDLKILALFTRVYHKLRS